MKYVIFFICAASFVSSCLNGRINELSNAALTGCKDAVTLSITLCGAIAFWSGIMNIANRSGMVSFLSKILFRPLSFLFPGIKKNGKAMQYIVLNFISNLLGLGNASTPLGINAMRELKEEEKCDKTASRNMIMLVVMNTASIQFFPSTIVALRASHGALNAADIVPCVWIVSLCSLSISIISVILFGKITARRNKSNE